MLLAELFEQLLEELHFVEHDLHYWRLAFVVTEDQIFLGGLGRFEGFLEGELPDQLIIFIIYLNPSLFVEVNLLIMEIILSASDLAQGARSDPLLRCTTQLVGVQS